MQFFFYFGPTDIRNPLTGARIFDMTAPHDGVHHLHAVCIFICLIVGWCCAGKKAAA